MLITALWIGAFTILFSFFYYYIPRQRALKILKNIPGPPAHPFFGNILQFKNYDSHFAWMQKMSETYGDLFKFSTFKDVAVVLSNPKDVEVLLSSQRHIEKKDIFYDFMKSWLGEDSIVLVRGVKWREYRKIITPTFHFNILEKFFEVFNEQSNVLIKVMKERSKPGVNFDSNRTFQLFALDVICETAMGMKINAQTKEDDDYVKAVETQRFVITSRLGNILEHIKLTYQFSATARKEKQALKILNNIHGKIIHTRREELKKNKDNMGDKTDIFGTKKRLAFLDMLTLSTHTNGEPLTDQEIKAQVATFMFAGHDTTATTLSFLLYNLANNPHIQDELLAEQNSIIVSKDHTITFQDIQQMNYLERTIKEGLRLSPSVPLFSRTAVEDLRINTNEQIIPVGASMLVFVYALHRNPEIYPEPEKFDPDRFLPENIRGRNPFAFIPFSAGPRNCIGQKFAMLEMKTAMSKIIRNFKILPAYDNNGELFKPKLSSAVTLTSHNGIYIRLEPRS